MSNVKLGILLWSQAASYAEMLDAAKRVDRLGYAHLWTWDHLYAIFGDPYQPIFEGWSLLNGWARETEQTRLGLLVGANTFRNPGLVAKMATTLDHASDGRAILGIGGAWMELEHKAHGIEFGTRLRPAPRLARRIGRCDAARPRWRVGDLGAGRTVCLRRPAPSAAARPAAPADHDRRRRREEDAADGRSLRGHVERDGSARHCRHKLEVLRGHCEDVGRDFAEIELTLGVKVTIRDTEAEADRAWKAAMEYNRTPMARSRTTTRSGTAPRSSSRTGSGPMSSWGSGP